MDYEVLKNYVDNNFTITEIARIENKSESGIRYWLSKYKIKRTGRERRSFTLEQFQEAVKNNFSVASTLTTLELVPNGANYRSFYKYQIENNIDISHFTGMAHLRGKTHSYNLRPLEEILQKNTNYNSNKLRKRLIKEGIKEHKCECCNLSEWLGEPIPIELDHTDGNHYNNTLDNLKILCPNCHAKTPTYRGKNKKKCKEFKPKHSRTS
jgi:Zn finger protein HypA/HybF involved in hydrogenase expression